MTRRQLEHAIRAACLVSGDTELLVFGSQAILGSFPDAPDVLSASIEVDVQPKNHPENTDLVDGALGELSMFHSTHGFYVHGLTIEAAVLPRGWEERTVEVSHPERTRGCIGHCLEVHDLAASKLAAGREKDLSFVTVLLREHLIVAESLHERVAGLPLDADRIRAILHWICAILEGHSATRP